MTQSISFSTLVDNLTFPEGPRWHEGNLWFSDMHDNKVLRWGPDVGLETMAVIDDCPSGLGFLPNGDLLIVSMHNRQVLRRHFDGRIDLHADLSAVASWRANDMLVDTQGRAYVGNFGDGTAPPEPITPAELALISATGEVSIAAGGLELPNGMALLDQGTTLVVAETRALPPRITTFTVQKDGSLVGRKVLVTLDREMPDGICADRNGDIWFASPFTGEVIKVDRAGELIARIQTPQPPYACALGGLRGADLFVCTADDWVPESCRANRSGKILTADVSAFL